MRIPLALLPVPRETCWREHGQSQEEECLVGVIIVIVVVW